MLFGFRTIAFKRFPIEFALQSIAKTGYDGVELCLENEELNSLSMTPEKIGRIKGILASNNLAISALSLHTDFVENENNFNEVFKGIQLTEEFNHKIFIISPGFIGNSNKQTQLKKLKEKLNVLLKEAEKRGVILALEAEPNMTIETSDETLDLIEFFGSDNLRINLDVGHSRCIGESVESAIMKLKEYIVHIHLEDIKDKVHKHLVPGEGNLEIKSILEALKAISYNGFVTVDLFDLEFPEIAAKRSIENLKALLNY